MQLYFKDDQPRMIFSSWKYARIRQNATKHMSGDTEYYLADAFSYKEALEHLILKSKNYSRADATFKAGLTSGSANFIDCERGDGFLLLMIPFEDWHKELSLDDIPEEYK